MSSIKPVTTITIAGLTGRISRLIATHILQTKPSISINGIARTPSKLPADLQDNPRVKVFLADSSDKDKIKDALKGSDICICGYMGGPDVMIDGQKLLIDACIEMNVPKYVASDWCIDFRDLEIGDHPLKDPMKHIASYLDVHSDKISGIHILNGAFTEAFFLPPIGIVNAATDEFTYHDSPNISWDLCTYADAARFTAEVACDPTASGYFNVLSDRVTSRQIAEAYKRVYQTGVKAVKGDGLEEMREKCMKVFREEPEKVGAWAFGLYVYWMQRQDGKAKCKSVDNEKYPGMGEVTTVEEFMRKHTKEELGSAGLF